MQLLNSRYNQSSGSRDKNDSHHTTCYDRRSTRPTSSPLSAITLTWSNLNDSRVTAKIYTCSLIPWKVWVVILGGNRGIRVAVRWHRNVLQRIGVQFVVADPWWCRRSNAAPSSHPSPRHQFGRISLSSTNKFGIGIRRIRIIIFKNSSPIGQRGSIRRRRGIQIHWIVLRSGTVFRHGDELWSSAGT